MKRLLAKILRLVDVLLVLFVYPTAGLLKMVRQAGVHRLPLCRRALLQVGVFPVRNHYYEPKFDHGGARPFSDERPLPGIAWNAREQLDVLRAFTFAEELADLSTPAGGPGRFHLDNGRFEAGDAEYWYQLVRSMKPRRIFEIGSGYSTLLAIRAIRRNQAEDAAYACKHVCIEPYEMPWLEKTGVSVVRKKVEELDPAVFSELQQNDVLFIDSSHVIRPQGDVLFEYLDLLPTLNRGVVVHVHDIFSPRDYPKQWLEDEVRLWNEQYLLETCLSHGDRWKIVGALNWLRHHHYDELKRVAPFLTPRHEPGSFYIQRVA